MDNDIEVTDGIVIPATELHFAMSRSGGPGGQHVAKTSSRVTLRWFLMETQALTETQKARVASALASRLTTDGDLIIHVDDERSQFRNKQIAKERLADLIKRALKPKKPRVKTKPSKAAKERRLSEKTQLKDKKGLRKKIEVNT